MDSVGSLWGGTWRLYKERFRVLMKIAVIPALFLILGNVYLRSGLPLAIAFGLLFMLAGWIIAVFAYSAFLIALHENAGFDDAYRRGARFFWPLVWMSILAAFTIIGGFVMVIIPGIILGVALAFRGFTLVLENRRGMDALAQSREYVRGYWWAVLGRSLLLGICVGVATGIVSAIFTAAMGTLGGMLASGVLALFLVPFSLIYSYLMYRNLAALKPKTAPGRKNFLIASAIVGLVAPIILVIIFFSLIVMFFSRHPELRNPAYWQQFRNNFASSSLNGSTYPVLLPEAAPSSSAGATGMHCGGFIRNAPTCPTGYHCQLNSRSPDTGGVCLPNQAQ